MKEFKNVFSPEITPWHKIEFSVATQLVLSEADQAKEVIPAGTLLKSKTAGSRIELAPNDGASIATVADVAEALAVLAHDVVVEAGVTEYAVGAIIKGVVYKDVMENVNTAENFTADVIKAMAPNITVYAVNTLNK